MIRLVRKEKLALEADSDISRLTMGLLYLSESLIRY